MTLQDYRVGVPLLFQKISLRDEAVPISEGIPPEIPVFSIWIVLILVKRPMVLGIDPLRLMLFEYSANSKNGNCPNSYGSVPFKLLSPKVESKVRVIA